MRTDVTEADFLTAIRADPADDTPRLIFADWLDEHGQPERAEIIRVQCEIATFIPTVQEWTGPQRSEVALKYDALRARERELLETRRGLTREDGTESGIQSWPLWRDWIPQDVVAVIPQGDRILDPVTFRRGFVASVTLRLADWLAHGPALVKCAPLEEVRLSDVGPNRLRVHARGGHRERWVFPREPFQQLPKDFDDWFLLSWHATEADALAVLSRACLAWALAQDAQPAPRCT